MGRVVSLIRELGERRMFRILVSYLAAGWVVLQVVSQLVAHGLVPNVVYILALIWFAGGLPGILMIGWYHGEKGDQTAPKVEVFFLSMLGVVLLGISTVAVSGHVERGRAVATAESGLNLRRVAVLYFRNLSEGGEQQYLADGLTEDLIAELSRVPTLDVISRNGTAPFRGTDVPRDSIGMLLEAGTLVDGSIEQVGERVRVNLRLIDGLSGAEFKRVAFEKPVADLQAIREELAQETSRFLREWMGDEVRLRELAMETESNAAWALYQRAEKVRKDAEALYHHGDAAGMARLFEEADAMLAQAEVLDTTWTEPTVLRGVIAYRRSRLAHGAPDAVEWLQAGMEHAARALQKSAREAKALELRGTLQYWHWILHVTPDEEEHERLLAGARSDLERAADLDPTLASAFSTLSHLYYRDDIPSAVLAARKAYEEDAYLDSASEILWRLSLGSYDMGQFTQSKRWCDEGGRRFAADHRFAACRILLKTTAAEEPDVEQAWQQLARLDSLAPPASRDVWRAWGRIATGGVIARAGMPDSARAVLGRARAMHAPDPAGDLMTLEAYMRTLAGDTSEAIGLLRRHAAVNPHFSFDHHWWWQDLRSQPQFRSLLTDH